MLNVPIIKSKLLLPELPETIITTGRISELCNSICNQRISLITAPSGYGKTTLALLHAGNCCSKGTYAGWYRMEQEDKDPYIFFMHLVEALFCGSSFVLEFHDTLKGFTDINSQYYLLNALICQELWTISANPSKNRILLVLDDFHNTEENAIILDTLRYLICNAPSDMSFIITSRFKTGLITERIRLNTKVLELSHEDLALSKDESMKLVRRLIGSGTDERLIGRIVEKTEGWVIAIILICKHMSETAVRNVYRAMDDAADTNALFNYITSELLKACSEEFRAFLSKITVLSEFSESEVQEIFSIANTESHIGECEKMGLLMKRQKDGTTLYRLHSLFRETVEYASQNYVAEVEYKAYHLRAAKFYLNKKMLNRAIEHFVRCGDTRSALAVIEANGEELLFGRNIECVHTLLAVLDEEVILQSPVLLFMKGILCQQNDPDKALELFGQVVETSIRNKNILMHLRALIATIHIYTLKNDLDKTNRVAKKIPIMAALLKNSYSRGIIIVSALGQAAYSDKLQRGMFFYRLAGKLNLLEDYEWSYLAYSCMILMRLGMLDEAEENILKAMRLKFVKENIIAECYALELYSEVLFYKGKEYHTRTVSEKLICIAERFELEFFLANGKRFFAAAEYLKHSIRSSEDYSRAAQKHFRNAGNEAYACLVELERLQRTVSRENSHTVSEQAVEVYNSLPASKIPESINELMKALLGTILKEAGRHDLAEYFLLEALKVSKTKKSKQVLCGIYLELASLYYRTGSIQKGLNNLKLAMGTAYENRYLSFPNIHIPTIVETAAICQKENIFAEYSLDLIKSYFSGAAADYLAQKSQSIDSECLQEFSDAFITKFCEADKPDEAKLKICLFGKFSVSVNGIVIADNDWKTRKNQGIIKYLLLKKDKTVSREQLMDTFWPESDSKQAAASLRVALSELRKMFQKYGIAHVPQIPFLSETINGLQIKISNNLSIDTENFDAAIREYKSIPGSHKSEKERVALLEKINSLYKGDLLEEDVYEDWTALTREKYKSYYLTAMAELSKAYFEKGRYEELNNLLHKVLDIDKYNEDACLRLAELFVLQNQKNRALNLCSEFVKILERELDTSPSEAFLRYINSLRA